MKKKLLSFCTLRLPVPFRLAPKSGLVCVHTGIVLLLAICSLTPLQARAEDPARSRATSEQSGLVDPPVAVVNGLPIKDSQLDAHVAATKLSREEALEDLIDLQLVRAAAAANRISSQAGSWNAEERAGVESALAKVLALDLPPRISLVVDHAWLKDAEDEQGRATGRALLVRLRALVEAGATIPEAYDRLQVKGDLWHIGDHEEYPYDVIPAEAHDLPPGSLSLIIPGDGGLHLFKIYQRKQELPSSDEIRGRLRERLRRDASIELPEAPAR